METLDVQDLGQFALAFLGDLEENQPESAEYYHAMFIVADLDKQGDIRVSMRTSGTNAFLNVRVLQAAQLVQTLAAVSAARGDDDDDA